MSRKKQNPYPCNLKINDLRILKLEMKIKELEERIEKMEQMSIVSLDPLPENKDTLIDDFHLCMVRENGISFDNIE